MTGLFGERFVIKFYEDKYGEYTVEACKHVPELGGDPPPLGIYITAYDDEGRIWKYIPIPLEALEKLIEALQILKNFSHNWKKEKDA